MAEFEDILLLVGEFGRYQILLLCVLCCLAASTSIFQFSIIFLAAEPDHWCAVPELLEGNLSFSEVALRNLTIPYLETDGRYDQCHMYDRKYTGWQADQVEWCLTHPGDCLANITACRRGWIFDKSLYESTITTDFNLVCERSWLQPTMTMVYILGNLLGTMVFGVLADIIGRKKSLVFCYLGNLIFVFAWPFSPTIEVSLVLRLIMAFFDQPGIVAVFIVFEMVGPNSRHHVTMMWSYCWALGYMITATLAFLVRDWFKLHLIIASCYLVYLPLLWFIPESPRWLYTANKAPEADKIVRRMAKVNGKTCPDIIDVTIQISDSKIGVCEIFRTPKLRYYYAIQLMQSAFLFLIYYGMSFNAPNLGSQDFANVFFTGLAEFLAFAFCHLVLQYASRKSSFVIFSILSAVILCSISAIPSDFNELFVGFAIVGKGVNTIVICIYFIWSFEILPTEIRVSGSSLSDLVGFSASLLAPYIARLSSTKQYLPLLIFGTMSLLVALITFPLPETKGVNLLDTLKGYSTLNSRKDKEIDTDKTPLIKESIGGCGYGSVVESEH